MIDIRTKRTRDEIEEDWTHQGFEKIFEEDDDQIWTDKKQDELLFVTWVNDELIEVIVFKRERVIDI